MLPALHDAHGEKRVKINVGMPRIHSKVLPG